MVARPVFEASLRVLWASQQPNGWDRLLAYYAQDRLKHYLSVRRLFPSVEPMADSDQELLDATIKYAQPMPSDILRLMKDVDDTDDSPLRSSARAWSEQTHRAFYAFLDPAAHGNLDILASATEIQDVANCHIVCDIATLNTIRAVEAVAPSSGQRAERFTQRFLSPYERAQRPRRGSVLRKLVHLTGGRVFLR